MSEYGLVDGLFLCPTPIGAYYAVASLDEDSKSRKFIKRLLNSPSTPELTIETLVDLMDEDDESKALDLLRHCQKLGWVQGVENPISAPRGALEETLPQLLKNISETEKVLLADEHGFYWARNGFPHEVAEELSALSAEIATLHEKRSGLLINNLGVGSHAWAIVDAFGNSQTGFWPVYIGNNRFVIIITGIPHFNQPDFLELIWALSIRYTENDTI